MENQAKDFTYTYSATQQEEIRRIRKKYLPPEADKMAQLRRLDATVARPGRVAALALGIFGTLTLGVGMCCTMVWQGGYFVPGVVIGLVGIACVCATYPLYAAVTKHRRKQLAPLVMQLSEELLGHQ